MLLHTEDCVDPRGKDFLLKVFEELGEAFGGKTPEDGLQIFEEFFAGTGLWDQQLVSEEQLNILVNSVNPDRLKNNPVALNAESIRMLYKEILKDKAGE